MIHTCSEYWGYTHGIVHLILVKRCRKDHITFCHCCSFKVTLIQGGYWTGSRCRAPDRLLSQMDQSGGVASGAAWGENEGLFLQPFSVNLTFQCDVNFLLQVVGDLWERGILMTSEPLEAHYDDPWTFVNRPFSTCTVHIQRYSSRSCFYKD